MISNDSNTVRKDVSFEIALTEYRGKVYGYSCSEFIINDTLYYIVKRVKGNINGDVCEVKDEEILSYNFHGRLDKGVKVIHTFRKNKQDSTWHLDGTWKTTATKNYYSLSGKTELKEEKDLANSKLFPHLEEMKLTKDVAFYQDMKKTSRDNEIVIHFVPRKTERPVTMIQQELKKADLTATNTAEGKKPDVTVAPLHLIVEKKEETMQPEQKKTDIVSISVQPDVKKTNENSTNPADIKKTEPVVTSNNMATQKKETGTAPVRPEQKKTETLVVSVQPDNKKTNAVVTTPPEVKNTASVNPSDNSTIQKKEEAKPVVPPEAKKTEPVITAIQQEAKKKEPETNTAAVEVAQRKSQLNRSIFFKSDSLELVLYDNGEVDGDTVSVLLNGEVVIAKQCLKAVAYKKTILIPRDENDSTVLVLYAENLGKYPPNTGLLIIRDGDDSHKVYFSADLQTNAAVILRRKK